MRSDYQGKAKVHRRPCSDTACPGRRCWRNSAFNDLSSTRTRLHLYCGPAGDTNVGVKVLTNVHIALAIDWDVKSWIPLAVIPVSSAGRAPHGNGSAAADGDDVAVRKLVQLRPSMHCALEEPPH